VTFDGGIIHGTTQWERGPVQVGHWAHGNTCLECGKSITNNALRCKRCRRQVEETRRRNRKRFAKRAAQLTAEDIEALTARQMASVRARLDVRRRRDE
jgi:tRNA(Ile2) C34 agmatinyltransferase TiaS